MNTLNIYSDQYIFTKERENLFNSRWLLLCHESELSQKSQYLTFNIGGEPLVLIRGSDNQLRCFFNICVHRGFPLFFEHSGVLEQDSIQCKYHGWKYGSTGTRQLPAQPCQSLQSIEVKESAGFVFIKIRDLSIDVSLENNRLLQEFDCWSSTDLKPANPNTFTKTLPINWKLFIENTLEGCHVPHVHNALNSLIGSNYIFESEKSVLKTTAPFLDVPPSNWTVKAYRSIVKKISQPLFRESKWSFYFLFPNTQITVTQEQVFYLQALPINESSTLIRGKYLDTKEQDRPRRLAQYLNLRLGRQIYREDLFILQKSQASYYSREFRYQEQDIQYDPSLSFFKTEYEKAMTAN